MEAFKECSSSSGRSSARRKSTNKKIFKCDHITCLPEIKNIQQPTTLCLELCIYGWYLNCSKKRFPACSNLKLFPLLFLFHISSVLSSANTASKNNFTVTGWSFLEIVFANFHLKATCNFFFPVPSLQLASPAWDNSKSSWGTAANLCQSGQQDGQCNYFKNAKSRLFLSHKSADPCFLASYKDTLSKPLFQYRNTDFLTSPAFKCQCYKTTTSVTFLILRNTLLKCGKLQYKADLHQNTTVAFWGILPV